MWGAKCITKWKFLSQQCTFGKPNKEFISKCFSQWISFFFTKWKPFWQSQPFSLSQSLCQSKWCSVW